MFANRFTALIDACSLVPALQRNLILSFAEVDLFRPRWSAEILTETERALVKIFRKNGKQSPESDAKRAVDGLKVAFADAEVEGFEPLVEGLIGMPDKNDRHVLAAAIETRASVIITENLKDFPNELLRLHDLEALSEDSFLADAIDLEPDRALKAIDRMLARLMRPALTKDALIVKLEANGLSQTADQLLKHPT